MYDAATKLKELRDLKIRGPEKDPFVEGFAAQFSGVGASKFSVGLVEELPFEEAIAAPKAPTVKRTITTVLEPSEAEQIIEEEIKVSEDNKAQLIEQMIGRGIASPKFLIEKALQRAAFQGSEPSKFALNVSTLLSSKKSGLENDKPAVEKIREAIGFLDKLDELYV